MKEIIMSAQSDCGKNISFIYRKSAEQILKLLKSIKMTGTQSVILVGISRHPGINQSSLSNILAVDKGAASKTLRSLELTGYIYKIIDENNRRNYKLYLTEKGEEQVNKSMDLQVKYWGTVFACFDEKEMETLNTLLHRLECSVYEDATS